MAVTVKKKSAGKPSKNLGVAKSQSSALLMHDAFIGAIKEAIGNTKVEHPDGSITEANEIVAAIGGKSPMANVGLSASRTIPLEKYSNIKIQVSLNAPAEMNEDDINSTFEFVKGWVDQKMGELTSEYTPENQG